MQSLRNRRGEIELLLVDTCSKLTIIHRNDPIRRLAAHVLEMAIHDFFVRTYAPTYCVSNSNRNRETLIQDSELWFFSDPPVPHIFAFENICIILDINADNFRKLLRQATAEKPKAEQCQPTG